MAQIYESKQAQYAGGLNLLTGFWLLLSPWIFGYAAVPGAAWNSIIAGIAIAFIAILSIASSPKFEGFGWLNALLGFWLFFAPSVLQFNDGGAAMWNTLSVGAFVLWFAIWRTASGKTTTELHLDDF